MHLESRYVAPFLFLLFAGALLWPEYHVRSHKMERRMLWATGFLVALIVVMLANSVIDQTLRGIRSTGEKASYEEVFSEFVAVAKFLETQGISPGAKVAIVGWPPNYWARVARLNIAVRVPDTAEFLEADSASRKDALKVMGSAGIKAVVAKGEAFKALIQEGWQKAPRTKDYFVFVLRT